jgi:N-formylglutamate deformylase
MILHIPHSSRVIPESMRDQFVLRDAELSAELTLMTDAFTDELFSLAGATILRFPISRLVVDVERFPDDADEPMSKVGMGMIYTRTTSGLNLRRALEAQERTSLVSIYETHHQALSRQVSSELARQGNALVVDCHSFPSCPLPCDRDQSVPRPDFCIGTDSFHTPEALAESTALNLRKLGYTVRLNRPYEGTLVPMESYKRDRRVASIMIEVNRRLYMDEMTGMKSGEFGPLKEQIESILSLIREFEQ